MTIAEAAAALAVEEHEVRRAIAVLARRFLSHRMSAPGGAMESRPRREERFGVAVALGGSPRYVYEVLAKKDYIVRLEGSVAFRPSGEALRIEVESALPAKSGDVIWAQLPTVNSGTSRRRADSAPTGLDAPFGKGLGDEAGDQLASTLSGSG